MNITSFTNQAVLLLQEQFGDSYHVFSRRVTKNNGVTLTGIVARRENVNSFPTIYVDDYYREDMSEKELRITVSEMADRLRQADLKRPVDLSDFTDFSRAKRKLSFKLINTEKNRKMLGDVPNRPFFNLSFVFCVFFCDCFWGLVGKSNGSYQKKSYGYLECHGGRAL